jgi:hypothetical protein
VPASNWHAVKSAYKKATLANTGEMIVKGNVIADMQSELETVKQRLEAVEKELQSLRNGLRGEQRRPDPKRTW